MGFRRRNNGDGGWWLLLVAYLFTFLTILTLRAVRELLKPNTQAYRPLSPFDSTPTNSLRDAFAHVTASQILAAAGLLLGSAVALGLLPAFVSTIDLSRTQILLVFVPLLGAGAALILSRSSSHVTVITSLVTALAFGLSLVLAVLAPTSLLLPFVFALACISLGITLLWTLAPADTSQALVQVWIELGTYAALLLLVSALGWRAAPAYFYGLVFVGLFFGAAALSAANPIMYLLPPTLSFATALTYVLRPTLGLEVVFLSLTMLLAGLTAFLSRRGAQRATVVPSNYLTDLPVPTPPQQTLVIFPAKGEFQPRRSVELVHSLLRVNDQLSFAIVADGSGGITWQLAAPAAADLRALAADVTSYHAGTEAAPLMDPPEHTLPIYRQVLFFGLANDYAAPLLFADDVDAHDPLTVLTERMNGLLGQEGERIIYQVVVTAASLEARTRAVRRLHEGKITPLAGILRNADNPTEGLNERRLTRKLDGMFYHCFVAFTVESPSAERLAELAQAARDIEQFHSQGHNRLVYLTGTRPVYLETEEAAASDSVAHILAAWVAQHDPTWRAALVILTPDEIAALWHLPADHFSANAIAWSQGRIPPGVLDPTDAVAIGKSLTPGMQGKTVYLKNIDRTNHHYIAGTIKAGKSTLMHRMVQADIVAGRGVAVIDPNGMLIDDILTHSIPTSRKDDVVLLDCGQTDYPVPLNLFRRPEGVKLDQTYTFVEFALEKIYASIWLEGQTERYLKAMIQLLLFDPWATPLDIQRVFYDDAYREGLLAKAAQSGFAPYSVLELWRHYANMGPGQRAQIVSPILNRSSAFLSSNALEHMTCHPYALDFCGFIRDQKIVLINLLSDALDTDVGDLAVMFSAGFFLASLSLGYTPHGSPPRFYLYIDELERVAAAPLRRMLTESRKFGLATILANQYLKQVPDDVLASILGVVGTKTVFELGIDDARTLEAYFEPNLTRSDLINLGLHRMAVKLRSDGAPVPAFVVQTERPKPIADAADVAGLRTQASQRLLPAAEVRRWLKERYRRDEDTTASLEVTAKAPEVPASETGSQWVNTNTEMADFEEVE